MLSKINSFFMTIQQLQSMKVDTTTISYCLYIGENFENAEIASLDIPVGIVDMIRESVASLTNT